jgi:multiple sugar transport system permease protein
MDSIVNTPRSAANIARQIFLSVVLLIMLFPLIWMIVIAFRDSTPDYSSFTALLKGPFTLDNFSDVLSAGNFDTYFKNSLIVAAVTVLGNVVFCSMVGYVLARRRIPGGGFWWVTVIAVMMIPPQVVMIPLYRLMKTFGWIDTYWALTIPFLVTPFGIFLMMQYIKGLPLEIEEAARIDGTGDLGILFRIVMPMARPMLVVLGVFTFLTTWNTFLYPFLFIDDPDMQTLTVGLTYYLSNQSIDWGHLMAGSSISALPVIILFLIFQKQIIQGMTAGAVKG